MERALQRQCIQVGIATSISEGNKYQQIVRSQSSKMPHINGHLVQINFFAQIRHYLQDSFAEKPCKDAKCTQGGTESGHSFFPLIRRPISDQTSNLRSDISIFKSNV